MSHQLSRRDFLKVLGAAAGGGTLAALDMPSVMAAENTLRQGRVAYNKVKVYDSASLQGNILKTLKFDEIIEIGDPVKGGAPEDANPDWYPLLDGGYVHSAGIQPVATSLNQPVREIPKDGLLAELTVPYTDTRWKPTIQSRRGYRLYYQTTYWVRAIFDDEKGEPWYRIYDDIMKLVFFIRAEHMRIVPHEELAPLSPDVPEEEKTLWVSLADQLMMATEGDRVVFRAKISSGIGKTQTHYASTPEGEFRTFFKRPAGHMAGGDGVSSFYDLPGVPWTSYINTSGVSFHGTYWHNDYGTRHSHGCINLPPMLAKWVYRWTSPIVPPESRQVYLPGTGTRVVISGEPFPKQRTESCTLLFNPNSTLSKSRCSR